IAAFADDAILPPSADEIRSNLPDSVISIHTDFSGLRVQHSGPIPLGAFYVPGVVAASITSEDAAGSESSRERVACRNLRVLYYHAKLFRKDFNRWPARLAELDGYIDFVS